MLINEQPVQVPEDWREATLLEFLRDHLGLTGSKFGCGGGYCGACTVHVDGEAMRACVLPLKTLRDASVTTIEGLAKGPALHPVQQAWVDGNVAQCGYCQPGQIMTAAALLKRNADPNENEIVAAMSGNLCRCGTYTRILSAVRHAATLARSS